MRVVCYITRGDCAAPVRGADPLRQKRAHANTLDPVYPRLGFSEWGSVSREGWVVPQRHKRLGGRVRLQLGRDAITGWLSERKITAVPSDAGRVAEQIIRSVGGLHSCALFAEEDIVKLLDNMAATKVVHSNALGGVEESKYPDRAVPVRRWEALFTEQRRKRRMPWITLETFTKSSVLRAGLEVRCPHCAQRNWFDLTSLDYTITCARCLVAPIAGSQARPKRLDSVIQAGLVRTAVAKRSFSPRSAGYASREICHAHHLDDHHRVHRRRDREVHHAWQERTVRIHPHNYSRDSRRFCGHLSRPSDRLVSCGPRRWPYRSSGRRGDYLTDLGFHC